jgi:preprotein translocase subunit SecF
MSDAAITTVVTGLVTFTTIVVGFLTMYVKLKYGTDKTEEAARKVNVVEEKIDQNTVLTKAGTEAAANNARIAARTANEAKVAANDVAEKINGELEEKIRGIVKEHMVVLADAFDGHMREIKQMLDDLKSSGGK